MGRWLIFNNEVQFDAWEDDQKERLSIPKTIDTRPDGKQQPVKTQRYAFPIRSNRKVICSIDDRADTTGLTVHTHEDLVQLGYLSNDVE